MDTAQIRELRENFVLSQEALARKLGVAVRTVARWESGTSKPSPLAIEKLSQILEGKHSDSILTGER
jgi:putative transcriptional regulator